MTLEKKTDKILCSEHQDMSRVQCRERDGEMSVQVALCMHSTDLDPNSSHILLSKMVSKSMITHISIHNLSSMPPSHMFTVC